MNELSHHHVTVARDGELSRFVETCAARHFGSHSPIDGIERRLNDYHSSFAIEEITVLFAGGKRLPLILKNLSPDALLEYARQIRPHFSYRSDREIVVYRDILAGAGLGTPMCYGALHDAERRRYWLLLEKVAGYPLAKTGEFAAWCEAARWLADLHCRFADVADHQDIAAKLLEYNEDFFHAWIDRAELFCSLRARTAGSRPPIRRLADQCRRAVRKICDLPQTFIHGEFYASNILIGRCGDRTRICPIDWETAAIGPGLLDVAALVAGQWTADERTELALAYFDALRRPMNPYSNYDDFAQALRCCRLFLAIKWLGWSSDWQAPDEHRCDWLAEAIELAPTIQ